MSRHHPDTGPLRAVPLFADCSTRVLRDLARHTDVVTVRSGRVVTRAGDPARELLVVRTGLVEVTTPDGTTVVAGPGTQVGGPQSTRRGRVPCTVVTLEPTTFAVVNGPALRAAELADEDLARRLAGSEPWSSPTGAAVAEGPLVVPAA